MVTVNRNRTDFSIYKPKGYPVKHRRKVPFEPRIRIGLEHRKLLSELRNLDSELDCMVFGEREYLELFRDAYASNIHRSVSIEGNPLDEQEVRRITTAVLEGGAGSIDTDGPRQEIVNHLYSFFTEVELSLPWSIDTVRIVHGLLTREAGIRGVAGGFRENRTSISGQDGFEYFHTCPPEHITEELASLLVWLNSSPFDEVVTATLFFHEFESIHPFEDGNGRAGRTMFHILLQELGLKNSKLCKIEKEILGALETYYDLLAYTDETQDYGPIIDYVLESLHDAYVSAMDGFRRKDVLRELDEASKTIAVKAKGRSWFTVNDTNDWVPSLGEQRIRHRLNRLVEMGVLEKEGRTKATRFRFNDPFRHLKEA